MAKINPNNGNGTKQDIFLLDIFKSVIIFFWSQKILKCFNDFSNWYFSISI